MNSRLARWYLLRAAMAAKARRERRRRRREVILLVIKILGEPAPDGRGRDLPGFSTN